MAIVATKTGGGNFVAHPEGQYPTLCVDVQDLGIVETTWQGQTRHKHMIYIYFYCGEHKDDGTPLLVRERFTLSLNENSRLRPFLENWRGRKFTAEEEQGFDVEKLIGAPAFVQIAHNEHDGKTYANVQTIMRIPAGLTAPEVPADFIRPSQRPPREDSTGNAGPGAQRDVPPASYDEYATPPFPEDDLPF